MASKRKTGKKWSQSVTETSNAMDVEKGTFAFDDPEKIARAVEGDAERSTRRKSTPYRSAMSMLTFYINRGGKNLTAKHRKVLEDAKDVLREKFGPGSKSASKSGSATKKQPAKKPGSTKRPAKKAAATPRRRGRGSDKSATGGAAALQDELLRALDGLPPALPMIEAVVAHADLQERELIKRATLTAALAQALQQRGVSEPAASLAADMGMGVFYVGFAHWLHDPANRELVEIVHEGFDQLKAVVSGT